MADVRSEPSMEEILASIKRIIADDSLGVGAPRPRPRADAPEPTATEPVLELTEPVAPPAPLPAAEPAPVAVAPPVACAPAGPSLPPAAAVAGPAASPIPPMGPATLVSDDTASASRQSLSALSSAVSRAPAGDTTVEGLVRELLRPMLREWLDARLPEIVEVLVSREIARITGKAL